MTVLKIGSRVKLKNRDDCWGNPFKYNTYSGSVGTVKRFSSPGVARVEWDDNLESFPPAYMEDNLVALLSSPLEIDLQPEEVIL